AVDFLVRTGQVRQAVPFLDKFLGSRPDDDTLLQIRDRYGVGSILRLDDSPETRAQSRALVAMLGAATQRNATRPDRLARFITALTSSVEEQDYAVERLREAGPYAIPPLIKALDRPGLGPADRATTVRNLARLGRPVVPPLIATLDGGDTRLVSDAAEALGRIGDPRAVPPLVSLAARSPATSPSLAAVRDAIRHLTGRPSESQPWSPVRLLTVEARKYHLHEVQFPGDPVVLWIWDEARKQPVPVQVSRSEAEAYFGLRLAREALQLDPSDVPAQVVLLGLALEKALERTGFAAFPSGDPANTFAAALAAGPSVLGRVLRAAIDDRKYDLAAVAATALGAVTDRDALGQDGRVHPLVEALAVPNRRVQLAAARALVALEPRRPFAGMSLVVPVLARFVANQAPPRAVVIDGNAARGGRLVGYLKELGYEPVLAPTGDQGFRTASESADVELILVDPHFVLGDWRLIDTISNLRADARTAGIPIVIVGPEAIGVALDDLMRRYPGLRPIVTPTSAALLEAQLGGRPSGASDAERAGASREAAALLGVLSTRPGDPMAEGLDRAGPALTVALQTPTGPVATTALGDVPAPEAQQGLADVLLNPTRPPALRLASATQLARSLQRFGPLVTRHQEERLLAAFDQEADPTLRTGMATVLGALRPQPSLIGTRLQRYGAPAASPAAPSPSPATPGAEASPPPAAEQP
ncbi:MAG: HEAT repeat domain-containing protein, partial [Planctomycetaceae bacterium]|nr:HEAT repeat domain-containing protein [Planctomycetaceae bacterium]